MAKIFPHVNPAEILTTEEVDQIHKSALEVLQDPGVNIQHQELLDLLEKAGADIEQDKQIAHIPSTAVEKALKTVPSEVTYYGRDPKYDMGPGYGKVVHTGSAHIVYLMEDMDTGEVKPATLEYLENITRIMDYIDTCHYVYDEVIPQDVPEEFVTGYVTRALLQNTEKPIVGLAFQGNHARAAIKMATAVAGTLEALQRRPIMTISNGWEPPLVLNTGRCEVLYEMAKARLPLQCYSGPGIGIAAPVTMAGVVVMSVAECLASVTLTQLVNPGTPVRAYSLPSYFNFKTQTPMQAPENWLGTCATNQVMRYLNIPSKSYIFASHSNQYDAQAGSQLAMAALFGALSGADVVASGINSMYGHVSAYYAPFIASDIWDQITKIVEGIEVNPDTIALDVIRDIGPGGNFMLHKHTRKQYKKVLFKPDLQCAVSRTDWEKQGSPSLVDKAKGKAKEVLANHWPKPLDKETLNHLDQILSDFEEGKI